MEGYQSQQNLILDAVFVITLLREGAEFGGDQETIRFGILDVMGNLRRQKTRKSVMDQPKDPQRDV
jgi:hypothetical protein